MALRTHVIEPEAERQQSHFPCCVRMAKTPKESEKQQHSKMLLTKPKKHFLKHLTRAIIGASPLVTITLAPFNLLNLG